MNSFNRALEMISEQLEEGSMVWLVLFGALLVITVIYFSRGIHIYFKRSVESANFVVFCIPAILWGFLIMAGPLLGIESGAGNVSYIGVAGATYLIPPLLMLHIWSQVSYRPITVGVRIRWLAVPILLIAAEVLKVYGFGIGIDFDATLYGQIPLLTLVANLYFIAVTVQSYLLCFNVFYQMPKHMRRSTYQMLIAITAIVAAHGVSTYFSLTNNMNNVALAIAYIIAVYTLFTAFFIANSKNVIVTSRDFVFSSLSTIVITVSLKGNILDWNRKGKEGCRPLPDPKYMEPYHIYRKRIVEVCNGTASPHDENIINTAGGDSENHFLFTWHDVSYLGQKFGYLVEIAEVTTVYSKLRYIEEIAYYDTLTSLQNRNSYIEKVKEISTEESMPLLIVIGDVNNLKKINDTLGHLYGDKLLLYVTEAVKNAAPKGAFVARIGGDELVMLLPNANERAGDMFIANVTAALNEIDDPDIGIPTISWGYSVMTNTSENYNDVFRAADAIMYEAKRQTRETTLSGIVPSNNGG